MSDLGDLYEDYRAHKRKALDVTTEDDSPTRIRITTATLRPESDRHEGWLKVFGTDTVPIISPWPHLMRDPDGRLREFYLLDVAALRQEQRERMIDDIVTRFEVSRADLLEAIDSVHHGVPILAEDVVVTVDARLFL